jgi:nucleotide-binding universal stress UspA family protein
MMMKKILFPTDFSQHSPELLKYAFELAKAFKATLVPMHVYGDEESVTLSKKEQNEMAEHISGVLSDFIAKNKPDGYDDVPIEYIVDIGEPGYEIVTVALDENINLIVMGMTGKGFKTGDLFGSTALDVIGKADCPVLAIPASIPFSKPQSIAYLTDFVFRDIGAINVLKDWANALEAKVHCLHVVEKAEDELDAVVKMRMLQDAFQSPAFSDFDTVKGNLTEQTNQYLHEKNIGIVAMLSRKRDLLQRLVEGSRTKQLAKKTDCPILVFKENAYQPISFPLDFSKFSVA